MDAKLQNIKIGDVIAFTRNGEDGSGTVCGWSRLHGGGHHCLVKCGDIAVPLDDVFSRQRQGEEDLLWDRRASWMLVQ
jgi:hypothetical protein